MANPLDGKQYWRVDEEPTDVGTFAHAFREAADSKGITNVSTLAKGGLTYDRLIRAWSGQIILKFEDIEALGNLMGVAFIWISGIGWDWANRGNEASENVASIESDLLDFSDEKYHVI